jgi:hypothetical protein
MRRLLVVALLIGSFATGQGFAASSAALPYDLQLASPLGTIAKTDQVLSGSTFGGVPVTGSVKGSSTTGTMTLFADGKLFASGTYSCNAGGCTFSGTVAGKTVTGMNLGTATHLSGVGKATSSAFPNHGAWVSAVTDWAKANLSGKQKGEIVAAASRIEGPQASGKVDAGTGGGHGKGKP